MTLNTFISLDGLSFATAAECAAHEVHACPGIQNALNDAIKGQDAHTVYNWCTNEVCACTGCINYAFVSNNLNQEHWAAYVDKHPMMLIENPIAFNVKMRSFTDADKALTAICEITGLGKHDAKVLLRSGALVKVEVPKMDAATAQTRLIAAGANADVIPVY